MIFVQGFELGHGGFKDVMLTPIRVQRGIHWVDNECILWELHKIDEVLSSMLKEQICPVFKDVTSVITQCFMFLVQLLLNQFM